MEFHLGNLCNEHLWFCVKGLCGLMRWIFNSDWRRAQVTPMELYLICSFISPFIISYPHTANYWSLILCRWFIPVNVVLSSIAGSLVGFVVATIVHPPYPFFKFTIVQIGIGKPVNPVYLCLHLESYLILILGCEHLHLKWMNCLNPCVGFALSWVLSLQIIYREYWECSTCPDFCFMSRPIQSLWRLWKM